MTHINRICLSKHWTHVFSLYVNRILSCSLTFTFMHTHTHQRERHTVSQSVDVKQLIHRRIVWLNRVSIHFFCAFSASLASFSNAIAISWSFFFFIFCFLHSTALQPQRQYCDSFFSERREKKRQQQLKMLQTIRFFCHFIGRLFTNTVRACNFTLIKWFIIIIIIHSYQTIQLNTFTMRTDKLFTHNWNLMSRSCFFSFLFVFFRCCSEYINNWPQKPRFFRASLIALSSWAITKSSSSDDKSTASGDYRINC